MNIKYLLPKENIQAVASVLIPLGRTVDWEMVACNATIESLSLTSDDTDLHRRILALCPNTTVYQRERIARAVNAAERAEEARVKRELLMAKIQARQALHEKMKQFAPDNMRSSV